jgi:hypothetical protein
VPSRHPGKSVHVNTLKRLCKRGRLRRWRFSGSWYVSRAELLGLFESGEGAAEPGRCGATRAQLDRWTEGVLERHGLAGLGGRRSGATST